MLEMLTIACQILVIKSENITIPFKTAQTLMKCGGMWPYRVVHLLNTLHFTHYIASTALFPGHMQNFMREKFLHGMRYF